MDNAQQTIRDLVKKLESVSRKERVIFEGLPCKARTLSSELRRNIIFKYFVARWRINKIVRQN